MVIPRHFAIEMIDGIHRCGTLYGIIRSFGWHVGWFVLIKLIVEQEVDH